MSPGRVAAEARRPDRVRHKSPSAALHTTYKKFESHFRVSPHVLSTGFNGPIPLGWAPMKSPPTRVPASDRLPSREGPRSQTERTHLDRVRGPNTQSFSVGDAGVQANRPCSKRA